MGFGQCNDFHRQSLTKGWAWCVPSLPLLKRSWVASLSVEIIISISNDFVSYRTTVWYKFTIKIYISSSRFEHFVCFFSFGFSLLLEFKYNFPFCYLISLYSYLFFCYCCASLCPSLCDSMDHSPLGSSSMQFPRQEYWSGLLSPSLGDLPNPRDQTHVSYVSCTAGRFFTCWTIREAPQLFIGINK